jgi:hypothetical protein
VLLVSGVGRSLEGVSRKRDHSLCEVGDRRIWAVPDTSILRLKVFRRG